MCNDVAHLYGELFFSRPSGSTVRWVEDEQGKYVCLTAELFDDLRRRAGLGLVFKEPSLEKEA